MDEKTLSPEERDALYGEGSQACCASHEGWLCSRIAGHTGEHIAASLTRITHRWFARPTEEIEEPEDG